jgi:hypothetical protein
MKSGQNMKRGQSVNLWGNIETEGKKQHSKGSEISAPVYKGWREHSTHLGTQ